MAPRKTKFQDDWKLGPNVCLRVIVLRMNQEIPSTRRTINSLELSQVKSRETGKVHRNSVVFRTKSESNKYSSAQQLSDTKYNPKFASNKQSGNRYNHVRTRTGEKIYKCSMCSISFYRSHILEHHIRIHTGEKPYKCVLCEKCFRRSTDLRTHARIHTGEKPYKCPICPKSFSQPGSRQRHIRTHTGEKPFKCTFCSNGYSESCSLSRHLRTHTGEKPYKCSICAEAFSGLSELTAHNRTHTG